MDLYQAVVEADGAVPTVALKDVDGALIQTVLVRSGALRVDREAVNPLYFDELSRAEKDAKDRGVGG
jgi:endonuclease YncB( thermonuclease family)